MRVPPVHYLHEDIINGILAITKPLSPVQKYIDDYNYTDMINKERIEKDTYLYKIAQETMTKHYENMYKEYPDDKYKMYGVMKEVYWSCASILDVIYMLSKITRSKDCNLVPTYEEHLVLAEISKLIDAKSSFDIFSDVIIYRLPKLDETPWEKIVEYRHHEFMINFRRTLCALQSELKKAQPDKIGELFDEIEKKHLKELLSILKPSVKDATVKGIITNLPLPIPVNPFGIVDSLENIVQQKEISDKYGWLYFLYDLT